MVNNNNSTSLSFKNNGVNYPKVLELLKVLENQKQLEDRKEQTIEPYNPQDDFISSNKSCLFECYYCVVFISTDNEDEYLRHVFLNHYNKPAYPSLTDMEKNNLKPKGKKWEI
jgi:hypothetical protein